MGWTLPWRPDGRFASHHGMAIQRWLPILHALYERLRLPLPVLRSGHHHTPCLLEAELHPLDLGVPLHKLHWQVLLLEFALGLPTHTRLADWDSETSPFPQDAPGFGFAYCSSTKPLAQPSNPNTTFDEHTVFNIAGMSLANSHFSQYSSWLAAGFSTSTPGPTTSPKPTTTPPTTTPTVTTTPTSTPLPTLGVCHPHYSLNIAGG
jgi:hypothetical protein